MKPFLLDVCRYSGVCNPQCIIESGFVLSQFLQVFSPTYLHALCTVKVRLKH